MSNHWSYFKCRGCRRKHFIRIVSENTEGNGYNFWYHGRFQYQTSVSRYDWLKSDGIKFTETIERNNKGVIFKPEHRVGKLTTYEQENTRTIWITPLITLRENAWQQIRVETNRKRKKYSLILWRPQNDLNFPVYVETRFHRLSLVHHEVI